MRNLLLPTSLCLAIAACGEEQSSPDSAATAQATGSPTAEGPDNASDHERRETATVGPLRYSYDPAILHRTEVQAALPPHYEDKQSGTKLIPVDRAELLGKEECSYGQSGMTSTCTADQEAGLEIVQLDGPLSRWRETFAESRIGAGALEEVEIGGTTGFRFTAQAEGSGAEYNFLPAGDSTILLIRQFRFGQETGSDEIARVIDELRITT